MRVKCISKNLKGTLSVGKEYQVIEQGHDFYVLCDDNRECQCYHKSRFEVIQEDKSDMVHHPNHYNYKSVECKDIIKIMCEGLKGEEAYDLGCAIKYLYRYPKKNNAIQDLEKAKTYIDMIINNIKQIRLEKDV